MGMAPTVLSLVYVPLLVLPVRWIVCHRITTVPQAITAVPQPIIAVHLVTENAIPLGEFHVLEENHSVA